MKVATLAIFAFAIVQAPAATKTWDGGDLLNTDWADSSNWSGKLAPVAGDNLVFPAIASALDKATNNNFAVGTDFVGLTFSASGYSVSGNSFDLTSGGILLDYASGGTTISPTLVMAGAGQSFNSGTGTATLTTGALNLNGQSMSLVGTGTINIGGNIVNSVGTPTLTKSGAGLAVLSGFNNFAGDVIVNSGTLRADGFIAGTGGISVFTGATLSGTDGGIVKSTSISGILAPGTAGDDTTTMDFGVLTFSSNQFVLKRLELDVAGAVAGDSHDRIVVSTSLTLNSAALALDFGSYKPPIGTVFTFINNTSASAITGTFTGISQGGQVTRGGQLLQFSYTGGTGNDFTGQVLNQGPVADDQSVSTNEDTAKAITLTGTDANPQSLTYTLVTNPSNGFLVGSGSSWSYTPNTNFNGSDSFIFRVSDGSLSSTGEVSITVNPVNDPPVANSQNVNAQEDTARLITLTGTDVENSPLSFSIVSNPANGTLSGTGATRTYTPNPNFNGPDSFTFRANDGTVDGNTATVSITVAPVNDAPVATPQSLNTAEDGPLAVTLPVGDVDGDPLAFIVSDPANGTLTGSGASRTYTPNPNFNGPDSFTVRANDGTVDGNTATVSISVVPVNDMPSFNKGGNLFASPDGIARTLANWATAINDGDPEVGQSLAFTVSNNNVGLFSVQPAISPSGTLSFTPAANASGSATVSVFLTDDATAGGSALATAQQTFTITISPPVTVTVGPSGSFTSLTNSGGLFTAINTGLVTGDVTARITGDLTSETGTFKLNARPPGSSFSVRIHPVGAPRLISGTNAGALIRLDAVDHVTIDGSLDGTGNDRSLSITNNDPGSASAVVWLQSNGTDGATNNTIRNLIVRGSGNTQTLFGIGSGGNAIGLTSAGTGNHQNTFHNNEISRVLYGVFSRGASAASKNLGNVVSRNVMETSAPDNVGRGGILLGFEDNVSVTENRVAGITSSFSTDVFGISLGLNDFGANQFAGSEVTNATITGNVIRGVTHTGTFAAGGIVVAAATTGTTLIANNSISGIGTNGTDLDLGAGIFVGGGTGSTTRVIFNSISVSGSFSTSSTAAESNFAVAIGSGDPILEMRNNALSNTLDYTSANTAQGVSHAIGAASTTFSNLTSDHNLLFTPTGPKFALAKTGSLSRTGGVTRMSLAEWQAVTGRESDSLSVDPVFNSTNNLAPGLASPMPGAGVTIPGVLVDVTGFTRSATAPTIGAYEVAADQAPPVIAFTRLLRTGILASRPLAGVSITDPAGVAVAAGIRPRIYFKRANDANVLLDSTPATDGWKFSEAAGSGNSPFTFLIDYTLLSGGGGVVQGDVIQYFVVAQDSQGAPLTGSSGAVFASPPASVALGSSAFPVSGVIDSYKVASLSGVVTVGPGGDFSSLTNSGGLFEAINESVLAGNLVAQITGNTSELAGIALNAPLEEPSGSLFSIHIHPVGAPRRISGNNAATLIRINAADRVTLDGSLGGTGTDRSLSITNNDPGNSSAVVWLQNNGADGATGNAIRNLDIRGTRDNLNQTQTVVGIGLGGSDIGIPGTGNSHNTICNNLIRGVQVGIYSASASFIAKNQNNVFSENIFLDGLSRGGILLGFENNVTVTNNRILGITRSTSPDVYGIALGTSNFGVQTFSGGEVTNAVVTGNVIANVTHTGTLSAGAIVVAAATSGTTLIANNSISGVGANATDGDLGAGIFVGGGVGSTTRVLYNSVSLSGSFSTTSLNAESNFAVVIGSGDPVVEMRNNALSNTLVYTTPNAAQGVSHVIGVASSTFTNLISDHNLLFVPAAGKFAIGRTGTLTRSGGTDHLTLADWQTASGKETSSLSADPIFASASDLSVLSTSPLVNGGTPVVGVTTDITGLFRSTTTPTIGAYETQAALEAWRQFHFGSTANSGDAANDFDFDHDGLVNLVEYAFGLDPKASSAHLMPQAQRIGNELVISFTPPPGVTGITYGAKSSTTLAPDDWHPLPDTGTPPNHEFKISLGAKPKEFVKLTITSTYP